MELSVVVPYLTEDSDFAFFENLENFSNKLRSQDVKLELIVACSSTNPEMLHKANLFANNLSYARVAFTKYTSIKKIIACGTNKCNRSNTLVLRNSFTGCNSIDYSEVIDVLTTNRRFSLVRLESKGTLIGVMGRSFDMRIIGDFLTGHSIDEVLNQITEFYSRWGTCMLFTTDSNMFDLFDDYIEFKFFAKLRLSKFLNSCRKYYISYLTKTKKVTK